MEYIRVTPPTFAVLQGRDTIIYPSLLFGARGAIPASGNVAPAICAEIYNAFERGDHAAAKDAQLRLNPVRLCLALATAPGGVKSALELLGRSIGPCRAPIAPLAPEKRAKMQHALEAAGLLALGS
jgi:4-hydroxy-tetrahydrodipicolinate synthase